MHPSPRNLASTINHRALIISDAPGLQDEIAVLLQGAGAAADEPLLECGFNASGEKGAAMVEAAVKEMRPFAVVVIDWRVFHGRDCTPVVKRMWNAQQDLHVVVHAVFDFDSRACITSRLGACHRMVVLKQELIPAETARMAQSLAVKWKQERELGLLQAQLHIAPAPVAKPEPPPPALEPAKPAPAAPDKSAAPRQIHRMETVGRLTDGVTHEFNNFLTVIQGHLSVAVADKADKEKLTVCVEEVLKEARRASELTRQLLAFSHRDYGAPHPMHLEQIVDEEVNLLRRTLGEQIVIEVDHETDLPPAMADPASFGQSLMSLAVRARDAMPKGGKFSIHTRRMHLPNEMAAGLVHPEAKPGDFVVVALADSGKALSAAELARVFDPPGAGTTSGLGLVVVQELVRHQGGWISVTSVPEVGTEFSIHLPTAEIGAKVHTAPKLAPVEDDGPAGKESSTILIVDDEDSVRQVMEFVLVNQGHNVVTAKDANEGWAMWCRHSRTINLAIIDIKLPGGVSGFDLERAISDEDCTVPVVFPCGYCPATLEQKRELKTGVNYLPKPFGMAELLAIVNKAMLKPMKF